MKYVKQPKRHIILDDFEWRALVKGVNEYRKQVIDENGCVEVVNDLLVKIIDAPTKKIKVLEVSKGTWVEAIFAKLKPETEKPRMKFASAIDDDDEDADVEIEDNYNKPDEDDMEIEDPNDDEITEDNYSTMMDLGSGDPDEEAENMADYGDE